VSQSTQQYFEFRHVFYRCETSAVKLREEHRLRVFENIVMMRLFGPRRDEVTGNWRKLHSGELHNLYSLRSVIRMIISRNMIIIQWCNSPLPGQGRLTVRFLDHAEGLCGQVIILLQGGQATTICKFLIIPDPPIRVLWQLDQQRHLVAKRGIG
jgi:hypothetical protein